MHQGRVFLFWLCGRIIMFLRDTELIIIEDFSAYFRTIQTFRSLFFFNHFPEWRKTFGTVGWFLFSNQMSFFQTWHQLYFLSFPHFDFHSLGGEGVNQSNCAFVFWNVGFNPCCFLNLSSSLLLQAPSAEKLPVLYLVDSIVKNVGGEYLAVFAKNLITSFICVFEKVQFSLLLFSIV